MFANGPEEEEKCDSDPTLHPSHPRVASYPVNIFSPSVREEKYKHFKPPLRNNSEKVFELKVEILPEIQPPLSQNEDSIESI
jgi:hypothetical protein